MCPKKKSEEWLWIVPNRFWSYRISKPCFLFRRLSLSLSISSTCFGAKTHHNFNYSNIFRLGAEWWTIMHYAHHSKSISTTRHNFDEKRKTTVCGFRALGRIPHKENEWFFCRYEKGNCINSKNYNKTIGVMGKQTEYTCCCCEKKTDSFSNN